MSIESFLRRILELWSEHLNTAYGLLLTSPKEFQGGGMWNAAAAIYSVLSVVGMSVFTICLLYNIIQHTSNFHELRNPTLLLPVFIRCVVVYAIMSYGMDFVNLFLSWGQDIAKRIIGKDTVLGGIPTDIPQEILDSINGSGIEKILMWVVCGLAVILAFSLSTYVVLIVYQRFFQMFFLVAISPLFIGTLGGGTSMRYGSSYLKRLASVSLQGAAIAVACILYSALVSVTGTSIPESTNAVKAWAYIGETIFSMLLLITGIKASERLLDQIIA